MSVLVTGAAGFIGFHTCRALLARGARVVGLDNLSDYYDTRLKRARLAELDGRSRFAFHHADVSDQAAVAAVIAEAEPVEAIVHLAAQAGVRHSLVNPLPYVQTNVAGQVVMLEAARRMEGLRHFVYASSSSVYGGNTELPFAVEQRSDRPVSLYAATKRAGELVAYTYSHLFDLPTTGLRFFTVYGPWGRPDMAPMLFAEAILEGRPIRVFNHGRMRRDFTYIDDVVAGVLAALDRPPARIGAEPPWRLYNLGNSRSEDLRDFIEVMERALGRKAAWDLQPMQPGDVVATAADLSASERDLGFRPTTPIEEGVPRFVEWLLAYREGQGAQNLGLTAPPVG
jgi:UDP-glucuronate 4-epimerase